MHIFEEGKSFKTVLLQDLNKYNKCLVPISLGVKIDYWNHLLLSKVLAYSTTKLNASGIQPEYE